MKRIIYVVDCLLIVLIPVIIITTPRLLVTVKSPITLTDKRLSSSVLQLNKSTVNVAAANQETTVSNTTVNLRKEDTTPITAATIQSQQTTGVSETTVAVTNDVVGSLCGYGLNCSGCSGNVASGKTLVDDIYYQDATYGKVRVVAAGAKYSFGTIMKISNSNITSSFLAIVLDRGGVGEGKKYFADLLFKTEEEASNVGPSRNVTFTILREGF